jgi:hypothetical protein
VRTRGPQCQKSNEAIKRIGSLLKGKFYDSRGAKHFGLTATHRAENKNIKMNRERARARELVFVFFFTALCVVLLRSKVNEPQERE